MKKCILCAVAMLMPGILMAAPVNKEAAKAKAAAVLQQQAATTSTRKAPQRLSLESAQSEGSAYYVFNASGNNGFAIVAGDDRLGDVIGYSTEGSLDPSNMPIALKALLSDYAEAMKFMQKNNINIQRGPRKAARNDIPHFVNFAWDQSGKYSQNLRPLSLLLWNQSNAFPPSVTWASKGSTMVCQPLLSPLLP